MHEQGCLRPLKRLRSYLRTMRIYSTICLKNNCLSFMKIHFDTVWTVPTIVTMNLLSYSNKMVQYEVFKNSTSLHVFGNHLSIFFFYTSKLFGIFFSSGGSEIKFIFLSMCTVLFYLNLGFW